MKLYLRNDQQSQVEKGVQGLPLENREVTEGSICE